jgi:hypothetical protein
MAPEVYIKNWELEGHGVDLKYKGATVDLFALAIILF